jgi:hypothetical protein
MSMQAYPERSAREYITHLSMPHKAHKGISTFKDNIVYKSIKCYNAALRRGKGIGTTFRDILFHLIRLIKTKIASNVVVSNILCYSSSQQGRGKGLVKSTYGKY